MKGYAIRILWRDGVRQWLKDRDRSILAFPSEAAARAHCDALQGVQAARYVQRFDIVSYPKRTRQTIDDERVH